LQSHQYLLLVLGFVLGPLISRVFYIGISSPGALVLLIAVITLLGYLGWLLLGKDPGGAGPKPGGEKQLLIAILDAGNITPVEAALKTSLTVDEAEEILTRLADRGHLLAQSRDGALFYALPRRRESSETWPR